jgi:hypothetical protein
MSIFDDIIFKEYQKELDEDTIILNMQLDSIHKRQALLQAARDNLVASSQLSVELKAAQMKRKKMAAELEELKENFFSDDIKYYQELKDEINKLTKQEANYDAELDKLLFDSPAHKTARAADHENEANALFVSFLQEIISLNIDFNHPDYAKYRDEFFSAGIDSFIDTVEETTGKGDEKLSKEDLELIRINYLNYLSNAEKLVRNQKMPPNAALKLYDIKEQSLYEALTGTIDSDKKNEEQQFRETSVPGRKLAFRQKQIALLHSQLELQQKRLNTLTDKNHKIRLQKEKLAELDKLIEKCHSEINKKEKSLIINKEIQKLKTQSNLIREKIENNNKQLTDYTKIPTRSRLILVSEKLSFLDKCYYFFKCLFLAGSTHFYHQPTEQRTGSTDKEANACHYSNFNSLMGSTGIVFSVIKPSCNQSVSLEPKDIETLCDAESIIPSPEITPIQIISPVETTRYSLADDIDNLDLSNNFPRPH